MLHVRQFRESDFWSDTMAIDDDEVVIDEGKKKLRGKGFAYAPAIAAGSLIAMWQMGTIAS